MADDGATPSPAELLRAALEKIVFFEWRLSELSAELAAAHQRCAAAQAAVGRAEEATAAAEQKARAARAQTAELEADRARLAALLSRPSRGEVDSAALEAERERSAQLQASLTAARRDLSRAAEERERWLAEMVDQTRTGGEGPAALAQFISELRGEIIALRAHKVESERLLSQAGIAPPPLEEPAPRLPARREAAPVEEARKLWAEGRLGPDAPAHADAALTARRPEAIGPGAAAGVAARALFEQSVRHLTARDPSRREQAARHLLAAALPAAAPALATALGVERAPRARAQMAKALIACGGEGAAEVVAALQSPAEPALVRMAAAEALSGVSSRATRAVAAAAQDPAAAVRRRAAALAAAGGFEDILALLASDEDASVRAAAKAATTEAAAAATETAPAARATPAPDAAPAPGAAPTARAAPAAVTRARPASSGRVPTAPAAVENVPARLREVRAAQEKDAAGEALHAVQAAIFGLTDTELAERIGLGESEATQLATALVAQGRLARRGKRLVFAQGGAL
ncbi:MAG TPA: hypothetical protein VGH20_06260 [Myxococcales bacterium]